MALENDEGSGGQASVWEQSLTPPTIGIGASAGGVQALQAFFEALPLRIGAAFVVVVHLDPESQSDLAGILASRTRMPVVQVDGPVPLRADHVYVIPPNRQLHITGQEIAALEFDEPRGRRAPIDSFFRSLAAQHGDGCAIILTGAGSDGTVGVKAVKEAGGIILVQDPREAEYASMPRSAISTGVADFVLPVREIAAQLPDLIRQKEHLSISKPDDEEWVRRILAHVRVRTGNDFSKYKRSTVLRRIARRMQVNKKDDLSAYYDHVRENADEAQGLLADLLISVTIFFRDSDAFAALAKNVVPSLFQSNDTGAIRAWVPGCATGEEAYTLAILLLEEASRHSVPRSIQVFGSDLDAAALAIAREGRYPAAIEADVSEERLHRFFLRSGDYYQVRRELRDVVLFADHSVLRDPPFSRIDLISCRNLLIYLDRDLQQQAIGTFHYALNPGGYLLLGASELADSPPGLFDPLDRKARIYQSTARQPDKRHLLPRLLGSFSRGEPRAEFVQNANLGAAAREALSHRQALEVAAPPSILVDRGFRAAHLSEHAGQYLQPSGGTLSGDVTDLVRPELRFDLRSALHRAFDQGEASLSAPILVAFKGQSRRLYLQVKPILGSDGGVVVNAIVMFIEGEALDPKMLDAEPLAQEPRTAETVRRLTQELNASQDRLRSSREESEAATEELRAANEELQSINEEYRSTSEELETSKEELQSINEELQTVNSELKLKLEAVSRAHSDLQNLMGATDFGILFLDSALRIKRFTVRVTDLFNITPIDEGRPIADFTHQLDYDELVADARSVMNQLIPIGRVVRSRKGTWYQMRMRPYRTVEDRIEGIVVSFVDISERRQAEEALRQSEQQLRHEKRLVELSHEPIFMWDLDDGILEWNRGCEELYGYKREEALGRRKEELLATEVPGSSFEQLKAKLQASGSWTGEVRHRSKDGRELTVETRIDLMSFDGRHLVLESTHNITDRKLWEKRQRLLLGELAHRVKNTLTVVQAIAHQTLRYSPSTKEFIQRFDGRLSALARAHNLLVESDWTQADLAALARSQLEPYLSSQAGRITIAGEPVGLPAELATPFGLVLHELATNAAKHGALSRSAGTVRLEWTLRRGNREPVLTVAWKEESGSPITPSAAPGLGSSLIDNGIPGATVRREFSPTGLVCTIELLLPEETEGG